MHVAVIGIGAMGERLARNLLHAGWAVSVFNRTEARTAALAVAGATVAATPRAAARDADVVLSLLRDDAASRAVWFDGDDAAVHGLRSSALAIESSTVSPPWAAEWAQTLQARGIAAVHAPIVGSRPQAERRQLVSIAGGASADLQRAAGVLEPAGCSVQPVPAARAARVL
jgi:3-hydroxyisobutyrate dehydrogenase-like beta-hydroxyacid dehydrogenase